MENIDFVLTWVDGSDPDWLASRRRHEGTGAAPTGDAAANADCRYRDNGLLRYWFRGVEKFAPWVDRVFFVTCGQKPKWLDDANPKLRLVNHADYIPGEWLPTFHSNAIELNLHRVAGLSERFVLFNDDVFLLRPVTPEFFFRGGLPVLSCDLGLPRWLGSSNISRIALNNSGLLKLAMDSERLLWRNWRKCFDIRALGIARTAKNVASLAVNRTVVHGCFGHLALPHLKSTFAEVWRRFPAVLERTSRHKFRADDCVNQWLCAAWNLTTGRFQPANDKRLGMHVELGDGTVKGVCGAIRGGRLPQLCLNDRGDAGEMARCLDEVAGAFESILPEKSSFER
ncbi:MAG: Stealth CR1 domain-containing protein [Kiritimatiellae bacterium]|nr:Stealth CR1 domain-containing protein [Kiritimatiellia bacterium]